MFVWDVDRTFLLFGSWQLSYYNLCYATAIYGGYQLWRWQMLRSGRPLQSVWRFAFWGVLGVTVGARLGHCLFYDPGYYLSHPLKIFYLWEGGLASHGATIGLLLAVAFFARREKMPFVEIADRLTMSSAWAAIWIRVGNLFNSEIVGRVTDLPWGVRFPHAAVDRHLPLEQVPWRHPSQLYEAALGVAVLVALILADRRMGGERRQPGLLFCLFLLLYFTGRFLVEFVKEYQALSAEASLLTMGQYLSAPFILTGLAGMIWLLRRRRTPRSA